LKTKPQNCRNCPYIEDKDKTEESDMNQIINMIMRSIMRKMVNKGIDAGFNKAASMRGGGKPQQPQGEIDDYGNPVQRGPSQQEVRAARRAKREGGGQAANQTKQAMKMARRAGKL
jgi:hypothetical protein